MRNQRMSRKLGKILRYGVKVVFEGFANPDNRIGIAVRQPLNQKRSTQKVR